MKKKLLLTSVLSIILCFSLICGATFALFTSESKVNIAVTSGKVEVVANVSKYEYSYDSSLAGANTDIVITDNEDGTYSVSKMLPGDAINFDVAIENNSNVAVKYQIAVAVDGDLAEVLEVVIKQGETTLANNVKTLWKSLNAGADIDDVTVTVALPVEVTTNMANSANIAITVNAIQGNVNVANVNADGMTTTITELEDSNGNIAKIPVGSTLKADTLTLIVKELEVSEENKENVETGYFELGDKNTAYAFEVSIPEIDENNATAIVVTMEAPKALENVELFHKGVAMTSVASVDEVDEHHEFYYDPAGSVTFATKNFSNFTLVSGLENVVFVGTAEELLAALTVSKEDADKEINKEIVFKNDIVIDSANLTNSYGKTGINILNCQTLNGNGYTLNVKGARGTWDSAISTTGGTIKNITVTGAFRGIFVNHNSTMSGKVYLENVIITGTTYTLNCDQGTNNGLEAVNCKFLGWTSFAKTLGEVKFENCIFGAGSGYNYSRPYAPTSYINCTFEKDHTMDPEGKVIFYGCNLNGVEITDANLKELDFITDSNFGNAQVGTIVNSGEEIQDAINNGEENIILGGDIDLGNGGLVFP